MASSSPKLLGSLLIYISLMAFSQGNFYQDVDIVFGGTRAKIEEGGQTLTLSMDKASGSGFHSKKKYLFGRFDTQIKLISGNSAGTVTTFYLTSEGKGANHDEIDLEFLGNTTGDPYILHTNVYIQGKGSREQGFYLWFDPTQDFHTYSIIWNPQHIVFLVDNRPIRVFENLENLGVPFPNKQAMKIHATLWAAEDWATRGGQVKTDWSKAPFTVSYRNFNVNPETKPFPIGKSSIELAQNSYMVYNYCLSSNTTPIECQKGAHINGQRQDKIKVT